MKHTQTVGSVFKPFHVHGLRSRQCRTGSWNLKPAIWHKVLTSSCNTKWVNDLHSTRFKGAHLTSRQNYNTESCWCLSVFDLPPFRSVLVLPVALWDIVSGVENKRDPLNEVTSHHEGGRRRRIAPQSHFQWHASSLPPHLQGPHIAPWLAPLNKLYIYIV